MILLRCGRVASGACIAYLIYAVMMPYDHALVIMPTHCTRVIKILAYNSSEPILGHPTVRRPSVLLLYFFTGPPIIAPSFENFCGYASFPFFLSIFSNVNKHLGSKVSGPPERCRTSSSVFFKFLFGAVPIRFTGFQIGRRRAVSHIEPCWHLHVDSRHPGQLGHRPGLRPCQRAREDML